MNEKVELHPDFEEWYNEIKSKWEKVGSHKQFAIYVINRMGFGGGLENSNHKDICINYPELRSEMQRDKEKYTRAILDDNWILRGEKLYYVQFLQEDPISFLNQDINTNLFLLSNSKEISPFKTKFTEKEIKAMDDRFWQFAETVEEEE